MLPKILQRIYIVLSSVLVCVMRVGLPLCPRDTWCSPAQVYKQVQGQDTWERPAQVGLHGHTYNTYTEACGKSNIQIFNLNKSNKTTVYKYSVQIFKNEKY